MDKGAIITAIAFTWILVGMIFFYLLTGTNTPFWSQYYYVWDKASYCLLVLALICGPKGVPKKAWWAMFVFLVIRLLWEALAIPNYKLASRWEIIDVLFLIDLIIIIYIFIITKGWRQLK